MSTLQITFLRKRYYRWERGEPAKEYLWWLPISSTKRRHGDGAIRRFCCCCRREEAKGKSPEKFRHCHDCSKPRTTNKILRFTESYTVCNAGIVMHAIDTSITSRLHMQYADRCFAKSSWLLVDKQYIWFWPPHSNTKEKRPASCTNIQNNTWILNTRRYNKWFLKARR